MSKKGNESITEEKFIWSAKNEMKLFLAIIENKPVGINKHFQMHAISRKVNESMKQSIPTKDIWRHLNGMYDLEVLDESEVDPLPSENSFFYLYEEYAPLKRLRKKDIKQESLDQSDDSNNGKLDSPSKISSSKKKSTFSKPENVPKSPLSLKEVSTSGKSGYGGKVSKADSPLFKVATPKLTSKKSDAHTGGKVSKHQDAYSTPKPSRPEQKIKSGVKGGAKTSNSKHEDFLSPVKGKEETKRKRTHDGKSASNPSTPKK